MKKVCILLIVCMGFCWVSVGSGPESPPVSKSMPSDDGKFHAWIAHAEHVFEANLMQLQIRLFPNTTNFPGLQTADVNRFDDMVVQATVRIDISVPLWKAQIAGRPQSHIQRESERGRQALEFCRRALQNASGLLVVNPHYSDSDRMIHCEILLIDEAGNQTALDELLVINGFAMRERVNWGQRLPRQTRI